MSYRLNQLAVGNFFLHFSAENGNREVQESLYKVIDRIQIDDAGKLFTLKCVGYKKSLYGRGHEYSEVSYSTDQDNLKFAPIEQAVAINWLERNKIRDLLERVLRDTKTSYEMAEYNARQFAEHFGRLDVIEQVEYDNTYRKETYPDDEIQF